MRKLAVSQTGFRSSALFILVLVSVGTLLLPGAEHASAQSLEKVQEQCREKLRPAVRACVQKQAKAQGGPPQKYFEGCRQAQSEPFRACVSAAMGTRSPAQSTPALSSSPPASPTDAQEQCREKLRPAVRACVQKQAKAQGGPPQKYFEGCRQAQSEPFRACVSAAMGTRSPAQTTAPALSSSPPAPPTGASDLKISRTPVFVAPPRNVSDITAILDQQKPDPTSVEKLRADAEGEPPKSGPLGEFYFGRCQARATLGRSREAIADCQMAIKQGGDFLTQVSRYQQLLSNLHRTLGEFRRSIEIELEMLRGFENQPRGGRGRMFSSHVRLALAHLNVGDVRQAEMYVKKNQALLQTSRDWQGVDAIRSSWTANVENGNAALFQARGQYKEAEAAYGRAIDAQRRAIADSQTWSNKPPAGAMEATLDSLIISAGVMKALQGRLAEGEADVRQALLSRLKTVGKYHPSTASATIALAQRISEQARFVEAEQLSRSAVDIYRTLGYPEEAPLHAGALNRLAISLFAQQRNDEAGEILSRLDVAMKDWDEHRRARFQQNYARIFTAYYTGKVAEGLQIAKAAVERQRSRAGQKHFDYAFAQAMFASGLVYAGRDAEAAEAFKVAMPVLLASSRDDDFDEASGSAAADLRMQRVSEAYLVLLARTKDPSGGNIAESFKLGDMIRGQSVQKALAASSARATAGDQALAELVRKEQDFEKAIAAELGNLNNQLALPPAERDDKALHALQTEITKLRNARAAARREISVKFPNYTEMVSIRPSTIEEVRAVLKPNEAFLSVYFGRRSSFVWALSKTGPVAFTMVQGGAKAFDEKVAKLRKALDPQAESASDIPAFDLQAAHQLYNELLKPVEAGWKSAKDIILVTNGALGMLPLGVLPTEPPGPLADVSVPFDGYRKVAWLSRTHAVTMVPSAAALRTLRGLKPGSPQRELMVGFGDPYFSAEQASKAGEPAAHQLASAASSSRGAPLARRNTPQTLGVDKAELGLLPRLPDTADELKSIALALQADPTKVLHLGKEANERNVKSMDLSKYKIIVFATHGLVPGELTGLTQPALAMTAPDVAQHDGDGLLTMEEILALKLDADWVVLSACNTGAGAGAGAEAASGLGRAFFYAGTRAILVTNWSVHSVSARELVTGLFARQAANPNISRGEALRQASMGLLDGPGFKDADGKTLFSYAHPLFWAPYTVMGDGG